MADGRVKRQIGCDLLMQTYHQQMRSLKIRNAPDDLMERLERLARASDTSVEPVAIRELDMATRRVDNAALLATLPDLSIPTDDIVKHVHASRR